jgi:hypothetical protein
MSTAARRARRRAALVIASLLLGLLLVFILALASVQGWITLPGTGGGEAGETATATVAPPPLEPGDVAVNVFNATDTAGLASRAGDALEARGFAVDGVANDPEGAEVPGVAIIRYGPSGERAARVLLEQLPEGVELVAVPSESATVDLVLGDQWQDLPSAEDAAQTEEG